MNVEPIHTLERAHLRLIRVANPGGVPEPMVSVMVALDALLEAQIETMRQLECMRLMMLGSPKDVGVTS